MQKPQPQFNVVIDSKNLEEDRSVRIWCTETSREFMLQEAPKYGTLHQLGLNPRSFLFFIDPNYANPQEVIDYLLTGGIE